MPSRAVLPTCSCWMDFCATGSSFQWMGDPWSLFQPALFLADVSMFSRYIQIPLSFACHAPTSRCAVLPSNCLRFWMPNKALFCADTGTFNGNTPSHLRFLASSSLLTLLP